MVKESIAAKQGELATAIANAEDLINSNASADQQQQALDLVKQLQADIKNLEALPEPTTDPEVPDDGNDDTPESLDPPAPTPDDTGVPPELDDDDNNTNPENDPEDPTKKGENRKMPIPMNKKTNILQEQRAAFNAFLHSRGEKRDGLTSTEAGVLIPEQIIYNPDTEVHTVADLSKLVHNVSVTTPSGTYPILKSASTVLPSVDELKENPDLANPEFIDVEWKVKTYRGMLPISEEAIADAQIDLIPLLQRYVQEIKINTVNSQVNTILSKFTSKKVAAEDLVPTLKSLKNKGFDPAYNLSFVMTQSLYDVLDQAKDAQGRYLLQDSISAPSGSKLFGLDVTVFKDSAFGGTGEVLQVFIGDLERAALFANRLDVMVNWIDDKVYGRVLQPVIRFDVESADSNAGVFVTITPEAPKS
ncbi:phage major capsid protein [Periweissella fabaria]|uniref:Phage capsid-like C-terminal domain-containing protein n=1 Tax=Periweissella fabaria TaxID=546157 RepID=A0ABN8BI99_9LACO|nr:phage major capsid protein [Periweissella fabaria]MCM0596273.1 phage major capsid protein [Periweissella fabaria]CAH0417475.1 hypothetical protein WFA24289_01816 [Periweissella fabaria]